MRVDGDAAVLLGEAKHHVAHVSWRPVIRDGNGDENMIVSAIRADGVGGRSNGQVVNKFSSRGVNHAKRWVGAEAERSVEVIVAWVVPNLISALRFINSRDRFAG